MSSNTAPVSLSPLFVRFESHSHTQSQLVKCTHKWTLDNFSFQCPQTVQAGHGNKTLATLVQNFPFIESVKFCAPNKSQDNKAQFFLRLYPKGQNEESKDHVSVFLYLASNCDTELTVEFKIAILDANENLYNQCDSRKVKLSQGRNLGWPKFIKHEVLNDKSRGLLNEDQLKIYCEVSFVTASITVSGNRIHEPVRCQTMRDNALVDFADLWENEKLTDVVFIVKRTTFPAHKAILAARSPVFAAMFEHDMLERNTNKVDVTDIEVRVFREFLRYIYSGQVQSLETIAEKLLAAADKYGVESLKKICEESLASKVSNNSAAKFLALADMYNAEFLKTQALDYIAINAPSLIESKGWKTFIENKPKLMSDVFSHLVKNCSYPLWNNAKKSL